MSDVIVRTTTQTIEALTKAVKVNQLNQRLIVNVQERSVAIVQGGPPGPSGPPGPVGPPGSGATAVAYYYTQSEPAFSWLINHGLGFHPGVSNIEEADTGRMLLASEIHHSVNQLELQFNQPRAGIARLI